MIDTGQECPAWIREFSRFLPLKKLLFVYGNILDLISYPIKRPGSETVYWTENDLPDFFERYLLGLRYEIIGFFDPIEGLSFSSPQMESNYNKISKGKNVEVSPPASKEDKSDTRSLTTDQGQTTSGSTGSSQLPGANEPFQQEGSQRQHRGSSNHNQILEEIMKVSMNKTVPCAFIFNLASRLVTSPTHLAKDERELFTRILKASLKAAEVTRGESHWNNVIILICDKLNDLPSFLFLGNPRARSIHIPRPDTIDRTRFIRRTYSAFYGVDPGEKEPPPQLGSYFAALSEGLTHYEMTSLVRLSIEEKIPIQNIKAICERYKYGITESEWDKIDSSRLEAAESHLKSRVKGQDAAVASVLDIIKRAKIGLSAGSSGKSSRPRGVLFFAGPTGVGKTELTKALAELLFGSEERCIRFDMSEYAAGHSDEKLMGAPPGYVGYEEGGQLTNAVKEHPFSVLLFDEIEKAHPKIFDKFLQILDDGRLTDGKGETVYFSESIIIFTSNLGTVSTSQDREKDNKNTVNVNMSYAVIKENILGAIRSYFNMTLGRPEILNRFGDNFVVFDFIRPPVDEEIVDLLLKRLVDFTRENKQIELSIDPAVRDGLITLAREKLHHGGRGVRNALDSALVNSLNRILFDSNVTKNSKVKISALIDNGENAVTRFDLKINVG